MPPKYFNRKDFSGFKIQNLQRDIYVLWDILLWDILLKTKKILIVKWADLCTTRELQVCTKAKFRSTGPNCQDQSATAGQKGGYSKES
jgi:hypothetical protein